MSKDAEIPSVERGAKPGYQRATFLVKKELLVKIKAQAYWQRRQVKKVLEEALTEYFKNRTVRPLPPKSDD
jgi:hypothetical protein